MSVLVKGMKMPRDCKHCKIAFYDEVYGTICPFIGIAFEVDAKRQKTCPLVEVPTPHGRLIDHKKLEKDLGERWNVNDDQDFCNKEVWHALEEAPTVIEAEE